MARSSLLIALCVACSGSTETVAASHDGPSLVGVWHNCATRLELRADGSFESDRLLDACSESGSWKADGSSLSLHYDHHGACAKPSTNLDGIVAEVNDGRLVLLHPELTGGLASYFPDSAPRARFDLTGNGGPPSSNGESIVRIVGDAEKGPFSGCYWSADGKCGGLFSCGGSVDEWLGSSGTLTAKLGCSGPCPCAAILTGKLVSGSASGTFQGADCNSVFSGSFEAKSLPEP